MIVHCKKDKFDVYIGSGSKWSNPYVIGKDGDKENVLNLYEDSLYRDQELVYALEELTGKVLGCDCDLSSCHGDILYKYANR